MRNKIQIAFDLGSYSIKSAVGRILPDGRIEVLSLAEIQSDSIDFGDIIDKDLLLSHLEILIEKMEKEEQSQRKIQPNEKAIDDPNESEDSNSNENSLNLIKCRFCENAFDWSLLNHHEATVHSDRLFESASKNPAYNSYFLFVGGYPKYGFIVNSYTS